MKARCGVRCCVTVLWRFLLATAGYVAATAPVLLLLVALPGTLDLALLIHAGIPAVAFTVVYGVFFPWHKDPAGQHLFFFTAAFSLLILRSVLLRATAGGNVEPASWYLRGLVYVIGLLLWQRLWLIVQAQWWPHPIPRRRKDDD